MACYYLQLYYKYEQNDIKHFMLNPFSSLCPAINIFNQNKIHLSFTMRWHTGQLENLTEVCTDEIVCEDSCSVRERTCNKVTITKSNPENHLFVFQILSEYLHCFILNVEKKSRCFIFSSKKHLINNSVSGFSNMRTKTANRRHKKFRKSVFPRYPNTGTTS